MIIRYYSDIHVEFQRDHGKALIEHLPHADLLILAGDIGCVKNGSTQTALKIASDKYSHVVFACGNHDIMVKKGNALRIS